MSRLKIVVTGGSGFVGSALVAKLKTEKTTVISLDRRSNGYPYERKVDILNLSHFTQALEGTDTVFHLAGFTAHMTQKENHQGWYLQTQGTLNALLAAKKTHVRRFILASSFYVYSGADPNALEVTEDTPLSLQKADTFGSSKLIAEQLTTDYGNRFGLEGVILRIGSVYGAGACTNLVGAIANAKLKGEIVEIWGAGKRVSQYTFLQDVVEGSLLAMDAPTGIYNLVSPEPTTTAHLANLCTDIFGARVQF